MSPEDPSWLRFVDSTTMMIVACAGAVLLLVWVVRIWQSRSERRYREQRREQVRARQDRAKADEATFARLRSRIIATSSTGVIAGFSIQRQIEAVFTEGHKSPAQAVEMLKVLAAQKGANALINVLGERQPSGKCLARGDAVIVRAVGVGETGEAASELKSAERSGREPSPPGDAPGRSSESTRVPPPPPGGPGPGGGNVPPPPPPPASRGS